MGILVVAAKHTNPNTASLIPNGYLIPLTAEKLLFNIRFQQLLNDIRQSM